MVVGKVEVKMTRFEFNFSFSFVCRHIKVYMLHYLSSELSLKTLFFGRKLVFALEELLSFVNFWRKETGKTGPSETTNTFITTLSLQDDMQITLLYYGYH